MKILCTKILRENEGKAFVYDPDISEGTKIHCAGWDASSYIFPFAPCEFYFSCTDILKLDNLWAGL